MQFSLFLFFVAMPFSDLKKVLCDRYAAPHYIDVCVCMCVCSMYLCLLKSAVFTI